MCTLFLTDDCYFYTFCNCLPIYSVVAFGSDLFKSIFWLKVNEKKKKNVTPTLILLGTSISVSRATLYIVTNQHY